MDVLQTTDVWQYAVPMFVTGFVLFALMRLLDHSVDPMRPATDREHVWPLGG